MSGLIEGRVAFVCRSATHTMSKDPVASIRLVEGQGVEGDAHCGETVKHRSRVAADPTQPNLRQLHLVHGELHDELARAGFCVEPGRMGENVTTRGIDLLGLPVGTRLHLGAHAIAEVTGLRNPCGQLNGIQRGLMDATLEKRSDGALVRKAGIMAVIRVGGIVNVGDRIRVELPCAPHRVLAPV